MPPIITAPLTMPWWKSKVFVGALVALACLVAQKLGLANVAPTDQSDIVDLILTLGQAGGAGTALIARMTQKHAPSLTAGRKP